MAESYLEKKEFNFFFLVDIPSLKDVRKGTAGWKLERRNTAKKMEECPNWLHPHALLFHTTCIKKKP